MSGVISGTRIERHKDSTATVGFQVFTGTTIQMDLQEVIDRLVVARLDDVYRRIEQFDQRLTNIENEFEELKMMIEAGGMKLSEERKLKVQKDICKRLSDLLTKNFMNKYVAITYDGQIVASAETDIELLKKLREITYPSDQIFLHKVGSTAVAGWL